jgi:hypothetical protein
VAPRALAGNDRAPPPSWREVDRELLLGVTRERPQRLVVAAGADGGVLPGALVLRRALRVYVANCSAVRPAAAAAIALWVPLQRCGRDRNDAARTGRRRRCAKRDRRIGSQSPVIDTPE